MSRSCLWSRFGLLVAFVVTSWSGTSLLAAPGVGYVPDKETAIKIAEAVWYPIYGELLHERPFQARLDEDGIWMVWGTKHPRTAKGGVANVRLRKADGCILEVWHPK